jgi:hypothetical protein
MKFLCTVWLDGKAIDALPEAEKAALDRDSLAYDSMLLASGKLLAAQALQSPETAVTVRRRRGKVAVTDGPFIETKEHLGGFLLIEARDRDEAAKIAGQVPVGGYGAIEVRPIYIIPGSTPEAG